MPTKPITNPLELVKTKLAAALPGNYHVYISRITGDLCVIAPNGVHVARYAYTIEPVSCQPDQYFKDWAADLVRSDVSGIKPDQGPVNF